MKKLILAGLLGAFLLGSCWQNRVRGVRGIVVEKRVKSLGGDVLKTVSLPVRPLVFEEAGLNIRVEIIVMRPW